MNKEKEIKDRIKSEQKSAKRITNNDLVCKDCLYKLEDDIILGNTSRCEEYKDCKPNKVLLGKECEKYFKE